jgi:hypothetical protein
MPSTADLNPRENIRTASIPAQPVSSEGTYDLLATLTLRSASLLTVTGSVSGTGPLTGLKLSISALPNGTHKDRLVDTDFNTPTRLLPFSTQNPHTTSSGNTFQFTLDATGVAELKLYAKSTNGASVSLELGC